MLSCAEFEVLLADSVDGALAAPGCEAERNEFARHLESCAACAAMAKEVRSAVAFMELTADPEPPQDLTNRILHVTNSGWELKLRSQGIRGWINRAFAPVLRPRFVMGAMLTMMSLTMLTRCAGGSKHTMTAADLDPVRLWTSLEGRGERVWNQAVKSYESMRVVYEIRNQISDWNREQAADDEAAADAAAESRRLGQPDKSPPDANVPNPGGAANQPGGIHPDQKQ